MISSITRGSSPFALPYITPTPTVRYDFTLGYGGNAASAIDTSGNSYNGTATNFNIGVNWLPTEKSGAVKIINTNVSNVLVTKNVILQLPVLLNDSIILLLQGLPPAAPNPHL